MNATLGLSIALLSAIMVSGCKTEVEANVAENKVAEVVSGTPIPLLLAQPISAGSTDEGSSVRFIVAKDVVVDGGVVVAKGAEAKGTVTWSRSEGTASALVNRPARLTVEIRSVKAVDGTMIPLKTEFQFNRGNTTAAAKTVVADSVWTDDAKRAVLTKLADDLANNRVPSFDDTTLLQSALKELGLNDVDKLITQDKESFEGVLNLLAGASSQPLGQIDLALSAVKQLGSLVEGIGDRLGGAMKGRTIRAPIGMEITARVEAKTLVKA